MSEQRAVLNIPETLRRDGAEAWVLQDADGNVLGLEVPAGELFGWNRADLLGVPGSQLVHPDDRDIVVRLRTAARVDGDEQWLRLRLRSASGDWYWAEVHFLPADDVEGHPGRCTIASIRDVSAAHVQPDTLELSAELRRSFASAESVGDAWTSVLSRASRASHASAALVWQSAADTRVVAHSWAISAEGEALADRRRGRSCSDPELGLGRAWITGSVIDCAIDEVCTGSDVQSLMPDHASRLIPLQTDSKVHCVVELIYPPNATRLVPVGLALAELGDNVLRRELERDLSLGELRFGMTFEEAPIGMALVAPDGAFLAANKALCDFLGRGEAELLEVGFQEVTHPDDLAADEAFVAEMLAGTRSHYTMEKRYVRPEGTVKWSQLSVSLVRLRGEPLHFISQIVDIDARKRTEVELEEGNATFRATFQHSGTGMALVSLDAQTIGEIITTNPSFRSLSGLSDGDPDPASVHDVLDVTEFDRFAVLLQRLLLPNAEAQRGEFRAASTDREVHWLRVVVAPVRDRTGGDRLAVVHVDDITDERRAHEELHHDALHDGLTGLPNRALIRDRIKTAQLRTLRSGNHIGVLYLDLDRFKEINDTFGHDAGDTLLQEVGQRFFAQLRPRDTAARLGGDEFVLLCEELDGDSANAAVQVASIADRLHASLERPIVVGDREIMVSSSIGTTVTTGDDVDVDELINNADVALYRAKAKGMGRTAVYDDAVRREAEERLRLGADLRHAQERRQLYVAYQPIVELSTGVHHASEALIRWAHPDMGEVPPGRFIVVAEESDLIVDVGQFVLDEAVRTIAADPSLGYVTVNVSGRQLTRSDFAAAVEAVLEQHGAEPSQLALELTEDVLMEFNGEVLPQLTRIRDMGVRIGVDDFGTGYSSLAYIKRLPVNFVKLDRSFVIGLETDDADRTITSAVIGLSEALGLDLIAEGVETTGQRAVLLELGCPFAQGFLFGRPERID